MQTIITNGKVTNHNITQRSTANIIINQIVDNENILQHNDNKNPYNFYNPLHTSYIKSTV